ncbi:MAG: radical SAM protein, partial [Nanoarchaeota archaeon]|nr:radical SAM protein [Nanoarchaeota archaeon]
MKLSQYNLMVEIEPNQSVLYNTFTRDYFMLDESRKKMIKGLFKDFHKTSYSSEEAEVIIKLTKNRFIVHDDLNELEKIKKHEEDQKTQQLTHVIIFKTTLDCNFRCTYCNQYHDPITMTDEIETRMVEYVKNESKKFKNIQLVWFGGEPLLEIDKMKSMSQKLIDVCSANDCDYSAAITTNGYLLNDETLSHFEGMRIKRAQITLDGVEKYHDLTRPHMNGDGTFDKIYKNILKLLTLDIALTLRINVNQENYSEISGLLDLIPVVFRKNIRVSMANWFQTT